MKTNLLRITALCSVIAAVTSMFLAMNAYGYSINCPAGYYWDNTREVCVGDGDSYIPVVICRCNRNISTKPNGCWADAGGDICGGGPNFPCYTLHGNCH